MKTKLTWVRLDPMHVFISWSGPASRQVAESLRDWMPTVIQRLKPWMSKRDIRSGAFWNNDIQDNLKGAGFGIVCVTPDNQKSQWLNFEAGAIAIKLKGKTCPYIFGMAPEELRGPLGQLQGNPANRAGTEKLMLDINNELGDEALGEKQFDKAFATAWKALEKKLGAIAAPPVDESQEPDHAAEAEPEPVSEDDAKTELIGWLQGLDKGAARKPIRFIQVDRECSLPAGTTKQLLASVVEEAGYEIKKGGEDRFLLKRRVYAGFVVSDPPRFRGGGY